MKSEIQVVFDEETQLWKLIIKDMVVMQSTNNKQFLYDLMTLNKFISSEVQSLYQFMSS